MKHILQISGMVLLLGLFAFGCSDDDGGSAPAATGDFSGTWNMVGKVTAKAAKTCESGIGDTFTDDVVITQEGKTATIQSGEGPITLTVSGNRATGSATYSEGSYSETTTVVLNLERGGSFLSGTVTDEIEDSDYSCTEVTELLGVKEGTEPTGDFNGYFNATGTIVEDTCDMGNVDPGCVQFIQYDDVILMIDDDMVWLGTVTGSTAVFPIVSEDMYIHVHGSITLVLAPDKNSIAGSQIMTLSNPDNPQDNCSINVDITGTRVTSCDMATSFGGFQLLR